MTDAIEQPLAGDGHDPEYARNDLNRIKGQQPSPRRQETQFR
jgi:hypothetical protein